MRYGCIGEKLSHSFSKEIHALLSDYEYEIREISRDTLDRFIKDGGFLGINVTIPYKEAVIPHLHSIDEAAEKIGAVNTIVNRGGLLYGYNTDFYGMTRLIAHAGVVIEGRTVAILGTGGTAKTADAVCRTLGAREVITVSRNKSAQYCDYDELYALSHRIDVIINTTPVGMYPRGSESPVMLERFPNLSGVIDAVYNPLRTRLVLEARRRGIPSEGGLYMLVSQAVRASEIFLGVSYPVGVTDEVYEKILASKENIVLIGMPSSGKSTVGKILADVLERELYDTDSIVVEKAGAPITEIFKSYGEAHFRDLETEAVFKAGERPSRIIATGGGAILRGENVEALRQNGRLFFLDRAPEELIPTDSRPLASDREAIMERYRERYPIYCAVCDEIIKCDGTAEVIAKRIGEKYL